MLFWTCLSPVVHVCLEILKLLSVQIRPDIFNQRRFWRRTVQHFLSLSDALKNVSSFNAALKLRLRKKNRF